MKLKKKKNSLLGKGENRIKNQDRSWSSFKCLFIYLTLNPQKYFTYLRNECNKTKAAFKILKQIDLCIPMHMWVVQLSIGQCMTVRKLLRGRKTHVKGLEKTVLEAHIGPEIVPLHPCNWHLLLNLRVHWSWGTIHRRVLPQWWTIISHGLIAALIPQSKAKSKTLKYQTVLK